MLQTNFLSGGSKGDGRNLLTGTKDFSGDWWEPTSYWTKEGEIYKDLTVFSSTYAWNGIKQTTYLEPGKYTFSVYVRSDEPYSKIYAFCGYSGDLTKAEFVQDTFSGLSSDTEWKRLAIVLEVTKSGYVQCRFEKGDAGENKLYLCGLKLERGTVTDPVWTPAPEDVLLKGEVDRRNLIEGSLITTYRVKATINSTGDIAVSELNSSFLSVLILNKTFQSGTYAFSAISEKSDLRILSNKQASKGGLNINNQYYGSDYGTPYIILKKTKGNGLYTATFTFDEPFNLVIAVGDEDGNVSGIIDNISIKLECGDTPTPWTPAPEDVVVRSELEDVIKRTSELERRNELIRIMGGNGDTFTNALRGRANRLTLLTFSSGAQGISDNPFTFLDGVALAFNSTMLSGSNTFILFALERTSSKYELKPFTILEADESDDDLETSLSTKGGDPL